jgi:hypothetical protein
VQEDKSGEDRRLGVTEGRKQVRSSTAVHKARAAAATERLEEGMRTSPYWDSNRLSDCGELMGNAAPGSLLQQAACCSKARTFFQLLCASRDGLGVDGR